MGEWGVVWLASKLADGGRIAVIGVFASKPPEGKRDESEGDEGTGE